MCSTSNAQISAGVMTMWIAMTGVACTWAMTTISRLPSRLQQWWHAVDWGVWGGKDPGVSVRTSQSQSRASDGWAKRILACGEIEEKPTCEQRGKNESPWEPREGRRGEGKMRRRVISWRLLGFRSVIKTSMCVHTHIHTPCTSTCVHTRFCFPSGPS